MAIILKQAAMAGTLESSDIQIMIELSEQGGIILELHSDVIHQYGTHIRQTIMTTLQQLGIHNVKIKATDRGALDCTIIARTRAAIYRSAGITENIDWKELDAWND